MQDVTLQVINVGVFDVEEGQDHAVLAVVTGLALPMAHPQTGEQLLVPDGQYRMPLQKSAIAGLIQALQEAHDKLPDPKPASNLVVPGSMQDVENHARNLGRLTQHD